MKRRIFETQKFLGLSLAGSKTEKTYIAKIEVFTKDQKAVLSTLQFAPLGDLKNQSHDFVLVEWVKKTKALKNLAVDVPLQMPKCLRCKLKCPGYEKCRLAPIRFMWSEFSKDKRKNKKLFSPYIDRPLDLLIRNLSDGISQTSPLSANYAPLFARGIFLKKHFPLMKEVNLPLSFYRLAKYLGLAKKHLEFKKISDEGDEARAIFLKKISERGLIFIYQQDIQNMVDHPKAFDAFLVAFVLYLHGKHMCENRPSKFPKGEDWPLFVKDDLNF